MQRTSEQTLRRRQAYLDEYMDSLTYRMMMVRAACPEDSFAVPETPNPNLRLSKRRWEEELCYWRNHVKMLANLPLPVLDRQASSSLVPRRPTGGNDQASGDRCEGASRSQQASEGKRRRIL